MGAGALKLYLEPNPGRKKDKADGGIRRCLDAQIKYLPQFGITVTANPDEADISAGHVEHAPIIAGKPFVSHNHGVMWEEYDWGNWGKGVNASVVNAMLQADAITVPSRWVANAQIGRAHV